ncbi:MAG: ABC transporter ATP-binding protein [Candidatus Omnitrophica bacterium]|jgi:lipoprotein-releasing system ATP-binding protein|nr:ABC transporter ATP-binding protein [Candidatus Omnitrophota bacterium]MDD3274276.1 ABC transporter ATP-binding protein [Candidatus Omnitrophota bacterium]MDD5077947.1 ABC transporter ATP-binding protein [Candidatus Omnitrophota bacterium]MDD5725138.1 ABC transporter ATP-binding protein [Candidatus Omnitrophota bacterium]
MSEEIIKASKVGKAYRDSSAELEVLKDISFSVFPEEFLVIQGPSGAGKSTLLHILGGLDNPSRGKVYFRGSDIYGMDEGRRCALRNKEVGFVFQFFHLLPELSALENVILPGLLRSWWERKKFTAEGMELLERLGLSGRVKHRPNALSGGEQQRVALARALINRPRLLLCDEPTGNLDSENGKNILRLLTELNREDKITVVMVTHDPEIASGAGRVMRLKDGMILN